MIYELKPYTIHEIGQRKNQEDSIFPAHGESTSNDRLFILCDGMGGHEKGEVASATVCETMSLAILSHWNANEPLSDDFLLQAIDEAYDALDAKDNSEERKMGTTMTFLCFHSEGATVAHIGDSRIYQLRPAKGDAPARIVFKTQDHSLVNDLVRIGEITEEEAKNHPQKNVITRAMQPCQERRSKADITHLTDIQSGDYFYMCSDGMLEQTTDENLLYIITKPNTKDEQKVEMLRNVTSENRDNHTAHLIYINKVEESSFVEPSVPISKSEEITSFSSTSEDSMPPQGMWITPEEEPAKINKKNSLPYIVAILSLSILSLFSLYFITSRNKGENQKIEVQQHLKKDTNATPSKTVRSKGNKVTGKKKETHTIDPKKETPHTNNSDKPVGVDGSVEETGNTGAVPDTISDAEKKVSRFIKKTNPDDAVKDSIAGAKKNNIIDRIKKNK